MKYQMLKTGSKLLLIFFVLQMFSGCNNCGSDIQLEDEYFSERTQNVFNYAGVSKVVFVDSQLNEYKAEVKLTSDKLSSNKTRGECPNGDSFEIQIYGQVKRIKIIIPNSSEQELSYNFSMFLGCEDIDMPETRIV